MEGEVPSNICISLTGGVTHMRLLLPWEEYRPVSGI